MRRSGWPPRGQMMNTFMISDSPARLGVAGVSAAEEGISPQAYKRLCQLIYERSRIDLGPSKQQLLTSRLAHHRRKLNLGNFDAYCDYLHQPGQSAELDEMIDLISTNHTHFFREPAHFELLTRQLLPELIRSQPDVRRELRCWSAASSSGEEAYTLAMTLAEFALADGPLNWHIHASDISQRMLATAKQSIYEMERLALPSGAMLARYFKVGSGPFAGKCKVRDALRERVTFLWANLFNPSYPVPRHQHFIFCRNVLIYFDKASQQELVMRLQDQLALHGYLLIGHTESLLHLSHKLKPMGNGIYCRVA